MKTKCLFQYKDAHGCWKTAFWSLLPLQEALKSYDLLKSHFQKSETRIIEVTE